MDIRFQPSALIVAILVAWAPPWLANSGRSAWLGVLQGVMNTVQDAQASTADDVSQVTSGCACNDAQCWRNAIASYELSAAECGIIALLAPFGGAGLPKAANCLFVNGVSAHVIYNALQGCNADNLPNAMNCISAALNPPVANAVAACMAGVDPVVGTILGILSCGTTVASGLSLTIGQSGCLVSDIYTLLQSMEPVESGGTFGWQTGRVCYNSSYSYFSSWNTIYNSCRACCGRDAPGGSDELSCTRSYCSHVSANGGGNSLSPYNWAECSNAWQAELRSPTAGAIVGVATAEEARQIADREFLCTAYCATQPGPFDECMDYCLLFGPE